MPVVPLTLGELRFERAFQRNRIWEAVYLAVEQALNTRGWTQRDLAKRLNRDPATISRWLSKPGNWHMDTIIDLLRAIDAELDGPTVRPLSTEAGATVVSASQRLPPGVTINIVPAETPAKTKTNLVFSDA